jgi:hypothetical protein
MDGMYDRAAQHGPIIGASEASLAAFNERQYQRANVGKWHKANAIWNVDHGTYTDPRWYIVGEDT